MTRRFFDQLTGDLFFDAQQQSQDLTQVVGRISAYASNEDIDRLSWWLHADRYAMRQVSAWNIVYCHLRAAMRNQAMALPARSVSEDSQRHRVGGAALGIYGENAVTSGAAANEH